MSTALPARRPIKRLLPILLRPGAVWRFLTDRSAPILPKLLLLASAIYLVSPVDAIPDLVPIVGWLDDVGASGVAITWLGRAVHDAEARRQVEPPAPPPRGM
jgi:uncharacterized membrane protein YkvA (DUF1232 family)